MHKKRFEDFEKEARQYKQILIDYRDKGKVFIDPNFHPQIKIPESKVKFKLYINWIRIDELSQAPLFDPDLIAPENFKQGDVSNMPFLASLMELSEEPHLIPYLFDHQSETILKKEKNTINLKCGAVVVYFHAFNRKTPVLIDTQIPCIGNGFPYFTNPDHCKKDKSLWYILVEKAYAKLCGSYSALLSTDFYSAIYAFYGHYLVDTPLLSKLQNVNKNAPIMNHF